mgnify:CR=1 FL=1
MDGDPCAQPEYRRADGAVSHRVCEQGGSRRTYRTDQPLLHLSGVYRCGASGTRRMVASAASTRPARAQSRDAVRRARTRRGGRHRGLDQGAPRRGHVAFRVVDGAGVGSSDDAEALHRARRRRARVRGGAPYPSSCAGAVGDDRHLPDRTSRLHGRRRGHGPAGRRRSRRGRRARRPRGLPRMPRQRYCE